MRFGRRSGSNNLPAVVVSRVMAACLAGCLYSQSAFSARFLVTPDDGYWELDGDYGSEVADKDHDKRTLLSDDITEDGITTAGRRDNPDCSHWSHKDFRETAPYMGENVYRVSCDGPDTCRRRSEQMMLASWWPGPDSTRYFSLAFKFVELPDDPVIPKVFVAQLHQGGTGPPPFQVAWSFEDGLVLAVYDDTLDAEGKQDYVYHPLVMDAESIPISEGVWYRLLLAIDPGPPCRMNCPCNSRAPGDAGRIRAWMMDNATGEWMELGSYSGRIGYWRNGAEGTENPECRDENELEYQWKVGLYRNNFDTFVIDYDNIAYGKRWNDITRNRLVGYHKNVLRLSFDEGSGSEVHDRSWIWNNGQPGDPVTDYDNDGRIVGTARWNVSGVLTGNASGGLFQPGRSLHFDGTNHVSVPMDTTDFDFGNYLTVSAWFRTNEHPRSNKGLVLIDDEGPVSRKVLFTISDSNLAFEVRHPDGTYSQARHVYTRGKYADGQWHQVAGTFNRFAPDDRRIKLYIDGGIVHADPGKDLPMERGDNSITIGKFASTRNFKGDIDEVNLFNYSMSEQEIRRLYAIQPVQPTNHMNSNRSGVNDIQQKPASGG